MNKERTMLQEVEPYNLQLSQAKKEEKQRSLNNIQAADQEPKVSAHDL
jgi:hypothetical protein